MDNITIKLDEKEGFSAAFVVYSREMRTFVIYENQIDCIEFDIEYLDALRDALNTIATMDSKPLLNGGKVD